MTGKAKTRKRKVSRQKDQGLIEQERKRGGNKDKDRDREKRDKMREAKTKR